MVFVTFHSFYILVFSQDAILGIRIKLDLKTLLNTIVKVLVNTVDMRHIKGVIFVK